MAEMWHRDLEEKNKFLSSEQLSLYDEEKKTLGVFALIFTNQLFTALAE